MNKAMKDVKVEEKEFVRIEAIINSRTPEERSDHAILNGSRRKRIAVGSGTAVSDVNRLIKQYLEMKRMLKMFKGKTDDEIVEYMQNRPEKTIPTAKESSDIAYNKKFQKLLKSFQDEYGADMNNSNDSEALINLVRHSLQLEKVNDQIIEMQQSDHQIDTRVLKNLGDYQRSNLTSSQHDELLRIVKKVGLRGRHSGDSIPISKSDLE